METKDIILELRNKAGLSQDELAEKVYVTRQAVSRWENGETTPNTETLKLLSKLFDVSINTLLGSPRQLICQCCGMPLEDSDISKEINGIFNEEYCKWCYADGGYVYKNMDDLVEFLAGHLANESFSSDQVPAYMKESLPKLNYWKRYAELGGEEKFNEFKKQLIFSSLSFFTSTLKPHPADAIYTVRYSHNTRSFRRLCQGLLSQDCFPFQGLPIF